jgi:hypothetical protein
LADEEVGYEGALDALYGPALLIDHAGDWDIEDIEAGGVGLVVFQVEVEVGPDELAFGGVDDGAVEDVGFEFLGIGVFTSAEDDSEGFALLLGRGGGGFDAGVEAREVVAGASCGVV